jgi:HK97 family phage portal protein
MAYSLKDILPNWWRTSSPNQASSSLSNPASWLTALFGASAKSGASVTHQSVISLSTVWRAVSIISQTLASLPFEVIEEKTDGSTEVRKTHDLYHLLRYEPSPLYSSFNFIRALVGQACFFGNGYAVINFNEDTARPKSFTVIDQKMTPVEMFLLDDDLVYKVAGKTYKATEVIHISNMGFNGLVGDSILTTHKDNYGLALSARDFGNNFFRNGSFLSGYLTTDRSLNPEARKRQAKSWAAAYGGSDKAGKVAVLDEAMKFIPMSVKPSEASMLETVKYSAEEVARIFGVPPHLLYALDRATYNNIEHLGQEFATYTIAPWAAQIEEEFSRKIFRESEKRYTRTRQSRFFARMDIREMLRADAEGRAKLYQSGIQNGWMTPNEARQREALNPVDGGDKNFIQLNMTTLERAGENNIQDEEE